MSESTTINFRAHPDLMRALCRMADDTDRSLSEILRRASADYLQANGYDRPVTHPRKRNRTTGENETPDESPKDYRLTSKEVERLTGATYRQIHYWVHSGLVTGIEPSGSGTRWRFDKRQVAQVLLAKSMLDAGWSMEKVRESMNRLNREGDDE